MSLNNRFFKKIFTAEYLFLFAVTLFIRFPFFFRDSIDHDESTFILIGNTITDGYLPYDYLWDLKPPLLFYVFAFVEYIFPHSLIAVRLFGVIIVFLSAVFLLQITRAVRVRNGFLIALSYIILSSLFGSLQCVMSEHVAMFFFLPGLLFYLKNKSTGSFMLAGIFFGCALLCKLNLAYTVIALSAYYFFFHLKSTGLIPVIKKCAALSAGVIIPFAAIVTPYLLAGKLKLFIDSVFMATLEYGHTTRVSVLQKLSVAGWLIALGLLVSFLAIKFAAKEQKNNAWLFIVLLLSTIFTFYSIGSVTGHYLIQIFPFLSILIFGFIFRFESRPGYMKYVLLVLLVSAESYIEYYRIVKQYAAKSTFYNGKAFRSLEELKRLQLEHKKIFFADYHIAYWFLHKYPLAKSVTHPSSLSRPAFFKHFGDNRNSLEEVIYVMEVINPEVIVSRRDNLSFFPETSPENIYFINKTKSDYDLVYQDAAERIFIWKKKEN